MQCIRWSIFLYASVSQTFFNFKNPLKVEKWMPVWSVYNFACLTTTLTDYKIIGIENFIKKKLSKKSYPPISDVKNVIQYLFIYLFSRRKQNRTFNDRWHEVTWINKHKKITQSSVKNERKGKKAQWIVFFYVTLYY